MMKAVLSSDAKEDLWVIKEHIARENPAAARELIRQIRSKIFISLSHSPYIGTPYEESDQGLRVLYVGSYGLFYRVTSRIEIVRILHQKRNIPPLLN